MGKLLMKVPLKWHLPGAEAPGTAPFPPVDDWRAAKNDNFICLFSPRMKSFCDSSVPEFIVRETFLYLLRSTRSVVVHPLV